MHYWRKLAGAAMENEEWNNSLQTVWEEQNYHNSTMATFFVASDRNWRLLDLCFLPRVQSMSNWSRHVVLSPSFPDLTS